jgi:hypothetical protein
MSAALDASVLGYRMDASAFAKRVVIDAGIGEAVHVKVASALACVDLPLFAGISVETLFRIRRDEEAFSEWRAELRLASRLIAYEPDEHAFAVEAQQVFEDLLSTRARAVGRAMKRSVALRAAAKDQPVHTVLGALFTSGGAMVAGLPIETVLLSALGGMAGRIAGAGLRRPLPSGSARIIAELAR